MTMAGNAAKLEPPLLSDYAGEAAATEGWATEMVEYFKTMDRLPGTDAIIEGFKAAIKSALAGMSGTTPPQGALKLQAGFVAAWAGISTNAASLYAGAVSATPPPAVATIAAVILPVVFPINNLPTVTKAQAATTTATALSSANATGGLWALAVGGTAPIT